MAAGTKTPRGRVRRRVDPKGNPSRFRVARTPPHRKAGAHVVVVGGSAGGFESLKAMLHDIPATFPSPILVVLHLDPNAPSNAAALLEGHTLLSVRQAVAGERPRPGTAYLGQPDRHLELRAGRIALTKSPRMNFSRPSVDRLLMSAAKSCGPGTTAVILSGTGFDGSEGVRRVKAMGGTCIVEDPETAAHPGMPEAAQATGAVDAALAAARIGAYLVHAASRPKVHLTAAAWRKAAKLLKANCDVDFQGYRSETLQRRMETRIAAAGSPSAAAYVDGLHKDAAELERLRSALLVKVSAFMRDATLWEALQKQCLAPLARRDGKREIRMWSAGCATGEEPYTLAMLTLAATRGPLQFKVFATDIDEPSLAIGRAARYPALGVQDVPKPFARRFFKSEGDAKRIGPEVRRHVIFGRHDLVHDPPLAGMDVVVCRNVLIYLKPPERQRAIEHLAAALRPGGILFLGRAEGAAMPGPGFARLAPGLPIFRRVATDQGSAVAPRQGRVRLRAPAHQAVSEPILLATDASLRVTIWNPAAEAAFGVTSAQALGNDLPRVLPGADFGSVMARGRRTRLPALRTVQGEALALEAIPLPDGAGLMLMGRAPATAGKHGRPTAARRARASHPEQASHESTESQQALNEELQSRNEELETVNEELQSLNDEIQVQGDEARQATLFLTAMLDSGPDTFIGCDRKGTVNYWGKPAVRQFGLSAAQAIGKDLLRLVPRLDVPGLRKLLRQGRQAGKSPKPRNFRIGNRMRVRAFAALDADGRSHGILLRVVD